MVQKLSTKAPLFDAGGSRQPGQVFQRLNTFATVTSTFERNPDTEAKVVARRITSITSTDLEPTGDEEGENMEDISREINEMFSDLYSPPHIDNTPLDHTSTNPITTTS